MPYEVHIGSEGFGKVRGVWEDLQATSAAHVFQTYGFAEAWLATAGTATRSTPIIARYESAGRTVGLFPACITHHGRVPLLTWLAGPYVLDYGDVLFDADASDIGVADFVTGALAAIRPHARLAPLYLTNVRSDALAFEPLGQHLRVYKTSAAPFVDTSGSFDDYLASRSRGLRRSVRKKHTALSHSGEICFAVWDVGHPGYEAAVRELLESKLRRYRSLDASSGAFSQGWLDFRVRQALTEPSTRLAVLTIGDRIVASQIACEYRGRLYLLVSSFDPEFEHVSPGFLLDYHSIEYAFQRGLDQCDFCWGSEAHKYHWTDDDVALTTFVSDDLSGRALTAAAGLRKRLTAPRTDPQEPR